MSCSRVSISYFIVEGYSRNRAMIFLLCITILVGYISTAPAATSDCSTPPVRCVCGGGTIGCSDLNLNQVPAFLPTAEIYQNIYLERNSISSVKAGDFTHLKTTDHVYISFADNGQPLTFEQGAFSALGDTALTLNLANITMELAFQHNLPGVNITELYIDRPTRLDESTLFELSDTLETLSLGLKYLVIQQWPVELRMLRNIRNFTVINEYLIAIPDKAFHGMEHNLRHLEFRDTRLLRFPDAVCPLHNLETLSMSHHQMTVQNTPVPHCQPMLSVESLKLDDIGLTVFPDVFTTFPSLSYLKVTKNRGLKYMGDTFVPDTTIVRQLDFSDNGLDQIPYAVHKMSQLRILDLSGNEISAIQSNDFENAPPIHSLILSGNPLVYVSELSLKPLSFLQLLDLSNTSLKLTPPAIAHLGKEIQTINLTGTNIECTCDMQWMLSWTEVHRVQIHGDCKYSKETFRVFIDTHLHECID